MWILGHSFISWARRGAEVKTSGSQLGFPEGQVNVHWFGVPVLRWPGGWGKLMASFVRKFGGIVVRHTDLEDKMPAYYREDGVYLSVLGMSFFTLALMEGIERALGYLDGGVVLRLRFQEATPVAEGIFARTPRGS
ncbi:hypothetical protein XELAEV_18038835mg [Xenopus laevis]|uniref:Uncharacterized protein n=1 Tax=Xenopus laevis TaxID=8355 RepID=A0A974C6I1_XENLA|nr:hypothetical protein XELAEV_18038835mg [Xenopus laevis]